MDLNNTGTTSNPSTKVRPVFFCPQRPHHIWDLNETTFPWILVVIISIASPVTILLNSSIIVAVKHRKELQKHSMVLLSSLAVADLLVGAINMPLSATVDVLILRQVPFEHICTLGLVNKSIIVFLSSSSLYHLTAIAWERYVAVQKCIHYKAIVTKSRVKKIAIAAWVLAVVTHIPAFIMPMAAGVSRKVVKIFHIGVVMVGCLIAIAFFYFMVYLGVRKRKVNCISNATALKKAKIEYKVAMTTGLLTAALIFSFAPSVGIAILENIFPVLRTNSVFRLAQSLVYLNSLVSPIVYCYRDRCFRNAMLALLGMGKPSVIQPAADAARFVRRKDPPSSVKLPNVEKSTLCLTRSTSCNDLDVALNCVHSLGRVNPEKVLKRSMSAPTLDKCDN